MNSPLQQAQVIPDDGQDSAFRSASQWEASREEYLETVLSLHQRLQADDDGMPVRPEQSAEELCTA